MSALALNYRPYLSNESLIYSAIFHIALIIIAIFGLPQLFDDELPPEPIAITVDILPISEISNVKPSEVTPVKDEKKPIEEKPAEVKPQPPTKSEKAEPPKPEPLPKPEEKKPELKKEEVKPEEKKPEEKKENKQDDLDSILKSVKADAAKQQDTKPKKAAEKPTTRSKSEKYDPTIPMSLSERDMIANQFIRCWTIPAGAPDPKSLAVKVRVSLNPDGTVQNAEIVNRGKYGRDPFYTAAADSALRAVHMCSPLQGLSADKYNGWRDMELNFDPRMLL